MMRTENTDLSELSRMNFTRFIDGLGLSDPNTPNENSSKSHFREVIYRNQELNAVEFQERFVKGNILTDFSDLDNLQKSEDETKAVIRLRIEQEKRAAEIVVLNKRYDEVQQEALEGEVIVGELIEEFSATNETTFTQQISQNPQAASSLMNRIDKAYSPVPKQAKLAEDLTAQLQKDGQTKEQKDQIKEQRKTLQDNLRNINLGDAGAVGMMSKKVDELQPDIHDKQKSTGSEFAETACNMINLGRALKGKPELSFDDYKAELEKEKAAGKKFSKLGNEAMMSARHLARELGITESNSHYASLQEFLGAHPELNTMAQKKLEELRQPEPSKLPTTTLASGNQNQSLDSAISAEFPMATIVNPNEPQVQSIAGLKGKTFRSATIVKNPDGSFTISGQETDTTNSATTINTTTIPAELANSAKLAEAAKQWVETGVKATEPSAENKDKSTDAKSAASEAAKPMSESKVSTPTTTDTGTKAAPTTTEAAKSAQPEAGKPAAKETVASR